MKKFGIIAIVLLAVTLGGVGAAHVVINSSLQDMTVKETTISGDKHQADGVTLHMQFRDYRSQSGMGYKVSYSVAEERIFDSGINQKENEKKIAVPHVLLGYEPPGYGTNEVMKRKDILTLAKSGEKKLGIPASEVMKQIDSAENGKKTKHDFVVADYMDYLPVVLIDLDFPESINLEYDRTPGEDYRYPESTMLHSSYFQVPVPKDLKAKLTIAKDKYGNIQSWGVDIYTNVEIESDGVLSEDTIYLATSGLSYPQRDGSSSHIMDMPAETHGIHRIPLEQRGQSHWVDMEHAECVYFLEPGEQILQMSKSSSEQELLLYTRLKGEVFLSVIDKSTMECLQKLSLGKNLGALNAIIEDENYLFFLDANNNFVVVDIVERQYVKKFGGTLDRDAIAFAVDYNGEKLAFATYSSYDMEGNLTYPYYYILQIYTEQGLVYSGFFEPSLSSAKQKVIFINTPTFDEEAFDVTFVNQKN